MEAVGDERPSWVDWRAQRTLPELTPDNEGFWTGGAVGELRIHRCRSCGRLFHPPVPSCHWCGSAEVGAVAVSGRGRVGGFTVVHHQWTGRRGAEAAEPGFPVPYVFALIELEEDPDVRVASNVIGCDPDDVAIGMPVEVTFDHCEDVWVPQFRPVAAVR